MVITEHIELRVKSGKVFAPMEKKSFEGKKEEVDHVKNGYMGTKNQFQKYNTPSPSFQINNINFNSLYAARKSLGTTTSITATSK
jgi:hypothetical protein